MQIIKRATCSIEFVQKCESSLKYASLYLGQNIQKLFEFNHNDLTFRWPLLSKRRAHWSQAKGFAGGDRLVRGTELISVLAWDEARLLGLDEWGRRECGDLRGVIECLAGVGRETPPKACVVDGCSLCGGGCPKIVFQWRSRSLSEGSGGAMDGLTSPEPTTLWELRLFVSLEVRNNLEDGKLGAPESCILQRRIEPRKCRW